MAEILTIPETTELKTDKKAIFLINCLSVIVDIWLRYAEKPIMKDIKKTNVFIYPLDNKVIFPYHEYAFSLSSHVYERRDFPIFSIGI